MKFDPWVIGGQASRSMKKMRVDFRPILAIFSTLIFDEINEFSHSHLNSLLFLSSLCVSSEAQFQLFILGTEDFRRKFFPIDFYF